MKQQAPFLGSEKILIATMVFGDDVVGSARVKASSLAEHLGGAEDLI